MTTDVNHALVKIGGVRGFQEVRSRGCHGPIEFEIKFRKDSNSPLATYTLKIDEGAKALVVVLAQGQAYSEVVADSGEKFVEIPADLKTGDKVYVMVQPGNKTGLAPSTITSIDVA